MDMIECLVIVGGQFGHQLRDVAKHFRDRLPERGERWITAGLRSVPKPSPRTQRKRPCVDAW
jgi:hypothetical protein